MNAPAHAPTWKRMLAPILDFFSVFFGVGYAIAWMVGMRTADGFSLTGWPALLLFAIIIAYFIFGRRFAGGTLWDRFLGIASPLPS